MYANPPYFLLAVGLLIGMACGTAFEATLKQIVSKWANSKPEQIAQKFREPRLLIPFLGIIGGIALFLAAGLSIFGLPLPLALAVSSLLTIFSGLLVWWQLGKLLLQLYEGGSQAIDLDAFF
ncbi:hypothetical protein [Geitlerinema sp. PCC 9228]|uniref:hypothetical protein n=1 Tax=Geitlerinema sp. PCC 9228 TaxID=111611 RepID=UPI0008F9A1F0|nr:hypothetical protein [Geitlerinema sp. PCC 9228]